MHRFVHMEGKRGSSDCSPRMGPVEYVYVHIIGLLCKTEQRNQFLNVMADQYIQLAKAIPMQNTKPQQSLISFQSSLWLNFVLLQRCFLNRALVTSQSSLWLFEVWSGWTTLPSPSTTPEQTFKQPEWPLQLCRDLVILCSSIKKNETHIFAADLRM